MSSVQIQFIARAFILFSLHFAFLLYKKKQQHSKPVLGTASELHPELVASVMKQTREAQ